MWLENDAYLAFSALSVYQRSGKCALENVYLTHADDVMKLSLNRSYSAINMSARHVAAVLMSSEGQCGML